MAPDEAYCVRTKSSKDVEHSPKSLAFPPNYSPAVDLQKHLAEHSFDSSIPGFAQKKFARSVLNPTKRTRR
jgi:hypothetical protein